MDKKNSKGRQERLPEDLEAIANLILQSMPIIEPPGMFQQSLRSRLVSAAEELLAAGPPVAKVTSSLRRGLVFGAAATLSVAGAAFILWRGRVLGEAASPAISSLVSRGGAIIRSEMVKVAR